MHYELLSSDICGVALVDVNRQLFLGVHSGSHTASMHAGRARISAAFKLMPCAGVGCGGLHA
jgi:hypothetical protein